MTRSDIRTLILDWLDDPNAGYFTTTIMNMRINLAQRELQKHLISANKEYYTKCVKTNLVAGQAAYALPSDFMQVIRLEMVTSGSGDTALTRSIDPITPNQRDILLNQSGDPQFYWFDKNNIVMTPVPNVAREIRLTYSYMIADMTDDADEPDAPEQFHEYIAVLCARDGFLKDGRPLAPIESKMGEYKDLLKSIANQRNMDSPRMITATSGGFGDW